MPARAFQRLLTVGFAAWLGSGTVLPAEAQPAVTNFANRTTGSAPLPPPPPSPVAAFRELLVLTPLERQAALSNRPPEIRDRILAKVAEYQQFTPADRELRLRATELRWYLTPLLGIAPTNRPVRLAQIPAELRPLVEERLRLWSILPPPLQAQLLEDDQHLQIYLQLAAGNASQQQAILEALPEPRRSAVQAGFARWQGLTEEQRQQTVARVNRFFELQPVEKTRVMSRLSDPERVQMEKSLLAFEQLPPAKRARCLEAFAKFANLNAAERAQFLVNADRWQAMSSSQRELFRRLVQQAPIQPPVPQAPAAPPRTAMTNRS